MKYVQSGTFKTEQLSITEIITETDDVILIAKDVLEKITKVPNDVKKELDLAINNLNQVTYYLKHIKHKTDIALSFVPEDVQEKELL